MNLGSGIQNKEKKSTFWSLLFSSLLYIYTREIEKYKNNQYICFSNSVYISLEMLDYKVLISCSHFFIFIE